MTEVRRWSEDGATPEELRVLEAARSLRPSPDAHARMAAALGVGASLAGAASGATTVGLYGKIAGILLAVGLSAGVAWQLVPRLHESGPRQIDTSAPPAVSPPAQPVDGAREPPKADAPTASSAEAQVPAPAKDDGDPTKRAPEPRAEAPVRPRSTPATSASAGLSEEVETLERARKALSTKSPDEALRELRAYNKRFPQGQLASEETVLRVQALLARGENAKAVALADQFAASHPESPLARRVQDLVRAARGKP